MKATDIVILLAVAAAFVAAVVHSIRARKKRGGGCGCGCGCADCHAAAPCGGRDKKRSAEAKPCRQEGDAPSRGAASSAAHRTETVRGAGCPAVHGTGTSPADGTEGSVNAPVPAVVGAVLPKDKL